MLPFYYDYFELVFLITLFPFLPALSTFEPLFDRGSTTIQILVEKPEAPYCVQEHFDQGEYIDAFAYREQDDDDVQMQLTLMNVTDHVIASDGPDGSELEFQSKATHSGLYTLCIKTSSASGHSGISITLGIFILPMGNATDYELPFKDDEVAVMKIENVTHIVTRVMLAINNAKHLVRQSALYLTQDTLLLESNQSTVTKWSLGFSLFFVLIAVLQVQILKRLFDDGVTKRNKPATKYPADATFSSPVHDDLGRRDTFVRCDH